MKPSEFLPDITAARDRALAEADQYQALGECLEWVQKSEDLLATAEAIRSYATCLLLEQRLGEGRKVTYAGRLLRFLPADERLPGEDFPAFAARITQSWYDRCVSLAGGVGLLQVLAAMSGAMHIDEGMALDRASQLAAAGALPDLPPEEPEDE